MAIKLHEILAVEADVENVAKKVTDEAAVTFSKRPQHFLGSVRTLEYFDADTDDHDASTERLALTTTVSDKLNYTHKAISKHWDVLYRKDLANQKAVADIVVDGTVLVKDVPAIFLLGLETKLKKLRELYATIPTLQPGIDWEVDPSLGENIHKMSHPEKKMKTSKAFKSQVLYDATKEHPAQIEKWEEVVNVGVFTKEVWSGMVTVLDKSNLLARVDKLLAAVKQARQRANCVEVSQDRIGDTLFRFIEGVQ